VTCDRLQQSEKQYSEIVLIDAGIQMQERENAAGEKKALGLRIANRTATPSKQSELLGNSRWFDCKQ
jgi:hypothetical protein